MARGANDAAPSVRAARRDGWCRGLALPEPAGMGTGTRRGPGGCPAELGAASGRPPARLSSLLRTAAPSSNVTVNDIYHEVIKIYFQRPLGNGPRKTRQQTEAGGRQRGGGTGREVAVICGAGAGAAGEPALPFPIPVNRRQLRRPEGFPGTAGWMLGHPGARASLGMQRLSPGRGERSRAMLVIKRAGWGAFACHSCIPGRFLGAFPKWHLEGPTQTCWAGTGPGGAGLGWDAGLASRRDEPPRQRALLGLPIAPCIPGGHCQSHPSSGLRDPPLPPAPSLWCRLLGADSAISLPALITQPIVESWP